MSSRTFCVINLDGSWPVMTVGGDIHCYQECFIQFKDAWKYNGETNRGNTSDANKGAPVSKDVLDAMQDALARRVRTPRKPHLVRDRKCSLQ